MGFDQERLALCQKLFYLLLPFILFSGVSQICATILNAGERFAITSFAPIVVPIATILISCLYPGEFVEGLAMGTVTGFAMEFLFLLWALLRDGMRISPILDWREKYAIQVIKQYLPMMAGTLIMSGTVVVDQTMATLLGSGSVSALNYGNKFTSLFLSICSMGLGTAVFPHFSSLVVLKNWTAIIQTLKRWTLLIFLFIAPLTCLAIYFSPPLVRLFFQRGAFQSEDSLLVSRIQMCYLAQIPFHLFGILLVRLISALKANRLLMWSAGINFFLNIFFNWVLMQKFSIMGIALSTTLVYVLACFYLPYMLWHIIKTTRT